MKNPSRKIACYAAAISVLLSGCGSNVSDTINTAAATTAAPKIISQPASVSIATNSSAVLSVIVDGTSPTFQWYKDGATVTDATAANYTATAAGTYYVVTTDTHGSVSSANVVVTVTSLPQIVVQPISATILTGSSQTLHVDASGGGLGYQWSKDGVTITGATQASYAVTAAGSYAVVVTNASGSVTSSAASIAVSATLAAPVFTTQPVSLTVNSGAKATLNAAATGTSIAYQWLLNGVAIAGATDHSFSVPVASSANAGTYTVTVTNTAGKVTSNSATLTVNTLTAGINTNAVVNAANAFLDTLSASQKTVATVSTDATTVLFSYTLDNAIQWTNLPGNRHGLRLNSTTLTTAQLAAANTVLAQAISATGLDLVNELRAADDILSTAQASGSGAGPGTGSGTGTDTGIPPTGTPPAGMDPGAPPPTGTGTGTDMTGAAGGYGAGQYSIAFIGTPSKTAPWILQLAGHHLAYNITYNTGKTSATPYFIGVEPPNWSVDVSGTVTVAATATTAGIQHAPLERQRKAMYNLAESIYANATTASTAKLSGTFTDVVMGASGNTDANFKTLAYPTSGRGLQYSAMNVTQQAYVRAAITAWVDNQASDVASTLLATYLTTDALNNTYVGYGVGQNGVKADFGAYPNAVASPLEAQRSYIRIDGPRVWIELVIQQGIVYGTDVHYHSIWRDKTADYGGSF
ncbi:DUF3500 domain-containing protein [Janthinobacterium sp. HLX7-2]|uniref:DUF3500 domain-containing protein n=1 Tax=Janthinobacterium sp. HLX7-2 TaxID=1259331 RepID=UPI003F286D0C